MKRRSAAVAIACAPLPLRAQSREGTSGGAKPSPTPYSGGGIRGLTAEAPDGLLVTAAEAVEFQGSAGFDDAAPLRPRALMPGIDVLQPQLGPDLKLKGPFPIVVRFRPRDDAAIVVATFKVLYGALRIDITSRVLKFVQLSAEGLSLDNAKLPAGRHRLTLQIEDEKRRVAERELRLEVE